MKSRLIISLILILLTVLMAACGDDEEGDESNGGSETPAETAVAILTAINEREFETARRYLCDASAEELQNNPPTEDAPSFGSIECEEDNGVVVCSYNIELDGTTLQDGQEIIFDIVDDKLCIQ